jgi:hypothetical protein
MNKYNYEVIVNINGRPVREYISKGKTFIEAREGTEYSIRIKNPTWKRVMAVVSVDGIDVLNGQQSSPETDVGYVIAPYGEIDIKGFRHNQDEVGAFKFVKKAASSANAQGQGGNEGVIGVYIFEEQIFAGIPFGGLPVTNDNWIFTGGLKQPDSYPTFTTCSNNTNYTVKGEINDGILKSSVTRGLDSTTYAASYNVQPSNIEEEPFTMGSTWGSKITDKVTETTFVKSGPSTQFEIFYSERAGLEALGISLSPKKEVAFPQAFPKKFSNPPAGWTGK